MSPAEVVTVMQWALWNLTGRTSYPPAWGAVLFYLLGAFVVGGWMFIGLVTLACRPARRLRADHGRPITLRAEPTQPAAAEIAPELEKEAA